MVFFKRFVFVLILAGLFAAPADAQNLPADAGIPVVDWKEAGTHRGKEVIVQGRIVQTRNIGKICFLNFDAAHSFTAIVHQPNYKNFPEPPEKMYDQKILRIRGVITAFRGKPQIEIVKPDQVTILEQALPIEKQAAPQKREFNGRVVIGAYNVLNLFDDHDDPYRSDEGTPAKPKDQLENIAKTIRELDADVLALEEVESRDFLERFVAAKLSDMGYVNVVCFEGNDTRGIDCAILSRFPVGPVTSHRHEQFKDESGNVMRYQRDLLQARIEPPGAPSFDMFVVHFKSKRGGPKETEATRVAECAQARKTVDAILKEDPQSLFVICGDFNDTWESAPMKVLRGKGSTGLQSFHHELPKGTNSYNAMKGDNMIDYILCSPAMARRYVAKSFRLLPGSVKTSGSDHNPIAGEFLLK